MTEPPAIMIVNALTEISVKYSLSTLRSVVGKVFENTSKLQNREYQTIDELYRNSKPAEWDFIILSMIFDMSDKIDMCDIEEITNVRQRIIRFHINNLLQNGWVYDNDDGDNLICEGIGFGITDKGIKYLMNHDGIF